MKTFIQHLIDFGFYKPISGNNDDNTYHVRQFMIEVQPNGWILYFDRLGSEYTIFKNTYLDSDSSFRFDRILRILSKFN